MSQKTNILAGFIILMSFASAHVEIVPIRTDTPPVLDGLLDDEVWQHVPGCRGFLTIQPDFGKSASEQTVARVAYDSEYLYFAIEALDSEPDKIKAAVTKWDNLFQDDWVGVVIDALNDQQSAYLFATNAYGSQGDMMLNAQGNGDPSEDFIWDAAGSMNGSGFSVEIRIPLQSIRFRAGDEVIMGIAFARVLSRYSEMAVFPPFSPEKGALTTQLAKATFRHLEYQRTYEILPSFTQSEQSDAEGGKLRRIDKDSGSDVGLTAKVGLRPTLTLDLTVNPDFSQVESDASQVDVNLRYPNFYPEKRPFFLEGIKNFDVAGIGSGSAISHLVHTRTMADPSFGLKLSGKLGRANSLAAILARDESPIYEEDGEQPADFGILRYKRLLKDESYIGGIVTVREHDGDYNRVAGLDGLWRLTGTMKIEGNAIYGQNKDPESGEVTKAHNADLSWAYGDRNYTFLAGIHDISKDFRLDTGYIPRDGTTTVNLLGRRTFYFESKLLQRLTMGYWGYVQRDRYFDMNDGRHNVHVWFGMSRSIRSEWDYTFGSEVYEGKSFDRSGFEIDMNGQVLKPLYISVGLGKRGSPYYNDPDDPFQGDVAYRWAFFNFQPTENFSMEFNTMREDFTSRDDDLQLYDYRIYRSKTTYQLNKYLFIRGILDYIWVQYPDYGIKYPEEGDVDDEKGLTAEFLVGFTYLPGTVIYLGYGSRRENLEYNATELDYLTAKDFTEMKRGLFFKASYNWRL